MRFFAIPILCPLTSLVYINNLHSVFSKSITHNFGDDRNLLCSSEKLRTIESVMNHEVKLFLAQCLGSNKLFLNEGKTELIIFRSP